MAGNKWFMNYGNDDDDNTNRRQGSRRRRRNRKRTEAARKEIGKLALMGGGLGLILAFTIAFCFSCTTLMSDAVVMSLAYVYQSTPEQINAVEQYFSNKENELYRKLNSVQSEYPGYDEYMVNTPAIGHDAFELVSFLSAKYTEFTLSQTQGTMDAVFNTMYPITTTVIPRNLVRYVPYEYSVEEEQEVITTDEDGNEITTTETVTVWYTGYYLESYTIYRLEVTVVKTELEAVARPMMSVEQQELYRSYMECHGGYDSIPVMY